MLFCRPALIVWIDTVDRVGKTGIVGSNLRYSKYLTYVGQRRNVKTNSKGTVPVWFKIVADIFVTG